MPRTRSLAWAELKIGILATIAIAVAVIVILMLSGQGGFFWQRYTLKAQFTDIGGIKTAAPVRVAGVEVGSVSDIRFVGAAVEVEMTLSRDMMGRVTTRSFATIGALGLLGEATVDITASAEGEPIPEGGYVRAGRGAGQIADVAESATRGLEEATRLMQEVRAGKGTVGRLFTDDQLYAEIQGFVAAAEDVASALRTGEGTIGQLVKDPSVHKALDASLRNLATMTNRLNAGEGSLGRLLQDEEFARSVSSASSNLDELTARMNRGEGTAGKLLTDEALYNRVNDLAGRIEQLAARLEQGQGTAGQLLQDEKLYDNMNQAATELRGLISDIRADPRRYLNMRVSIF
jgi:phospholipid/cholesterol/gamma-HCH transport system substrate-binding protein